MVEYIYIYTPYICISIVQNTFHIIKPMLCLYCLKILWTSSKTLLRSYQGHKAMFNTLICRVSNTWTMWLPTKSRRETHWCLVGTGGPFPTTHQKNQTSHHSMIVSAKLSTYPLIVDRTKYDLRTLAPKSKFLICQLVKQCSDFIYWVTPKPVVFLSRITILDDNMVGLDTLEEHCGQTWTAPLKIRCPNQNKSPFEEDSLFSPSMIHIYIYIL